MQHAEILALAGLRVDGRREDDLRTIGFEFNPIAQADGSVYYEQGLNKILVIVHGPQESRAGGDSASGPTERGRLVVTVENASFSGTEHKKKRLGDRRTAEMEAILRETLEEVIMLELYPKSEVSMVVHVLASDGSLTCCILNAACLALMVGGISMSDMVTACSVGLLKERMCQDCTQIEQGSGPFLPVAVKARSEEVAMLQLGSRLSMSNLEAALVAATDGCRKIRALLEEGIRRYMEKHPRGGATNGAGGERQIETASMTV